MHKEDIILLQLGAILWPLIIGTGRAFALASPSQPIQSVISRRSNGRSKEYVFNDFTKPEGKLFQPNNKDVQKKQVSPGVFGHFQSVLRSTFLPTLATSDNQNQLSNLMKSGYLPYIIYDNLQDLTTSLRSVLATQRILEGVGVGRADATALSATLNFLLRDGCGMIASLLFTSVAASSFRRNIKRWKYFADIMVDIGITLEIIAPSVLSTHLHAWFLPLLCLGNICKALCGVAAGATGGALQMFWAVKLMGSEEGISEVSAKSGAQRTVVGGLGLILAGITARWLNDGFVGGESRAKKKGLWIGMYCGLTLLHLLCNWRSLRLVTLNWLNGWRLHRVVDDFLGSIGEMSDDYYTEGEITCRTPSEVSRLEPILFVPELKSKKSHLSLYPIRMGVSFNQFAKLSNANSTYLQSILATKRKSASNDNYILKVGHTRNQLEKNRCILVAFLSQCSNNEKAKAYLHACLVGRALMTVSKPNEDKVLINDEGDLIQNAEEIGQEEIDKMWPLFERCAANAGWQLNKTEFSTDGYEICLE